MDTLYSEIDQALAGGDLKQIEVILARRLRHDNTPTERADLLLRRAQARVLAGRPDDAIEDVQTGIALDESRASSPDVLIPLGDIYFAQFELAAVGFVDSANAQRALEVYSRVIEADPSNPKMAWVYYQIGRIHLIQDRIDPGEQVLLAALDHPNQPESVHALCYERLGFVQLSEKRDPQAALDRFEQALAHYPEGKQTGWLLELQLRMSKAYLELGRSQEALDIANTALREIRSAGIPDSGRMLAEAHLALGNILATIPDRAPDALEHYLRFLQSSRRPPGIDVTWSQVYETIGRLSFRLERYPEAISAYKNALQFNPYHPMEITLRYQIARCQYRTRNYEGAIAEIGKMQQLGEENITDWQVFNLLGGALFAVERFEEAVQAYQHALELAPPGSRNLEKTQIYLRFSQELSQSAG